MLVQSRSRSLAQDSRIDPAGRTAAGPLRRGEHRQAGRRRHRTPPRRHAPPGPRIARRADRSVGAGVPDVGAGAEGLEHVSRRGVGDGDRERHHGRGPGRGRDADLQRGGRAARSGPLPFPQPPRRADRRHRHELAAHPRRRVAARRRVPHPQRSHRSRLVHRARGRSRAASS